MLQFLSYPCPKLLRRKFSSATRITSSLVHQGQNLEATTLQFHQLQKSRHSITEFQLSAILRECGKLVAIKEGEKAHCMIWKHGFHSDMFLMTSLLDMYAKCAYIDEARQVFAEMPERDVVATNGMISGFCRCHLTSDAIKLFQSMPERDVGSWNSLISGLGQESEGRLALSFFDEMRAEGVEIDLVTVVSVLSICADLAALINGKRVHALAIKHGFVQYIPVGNAVIDMYSKSGCMDDARSCFENMAGKNVISWSSLIIAYGKHGSGLEALKAFNQMEAEGVVPNKITFLGALYACSHAGLVQEGWRIYNTMVHRYSIKPLMEHYTSMVDLLARAGHLNDAYKFVESMPVEPEAKLLTAFLSSCCYHMNVELARTVGQKLLELEPEEPGAYMLLSNFYGLVGDLEGVAKVRRLMLNRGIRKEKANTWIEINRRVHSFESGDKTHPAAKDIYSHLRNLVERMKKCGYVPNTSMVMQNVEEHIKEEIVLGHSEKLAIVFGLISTPPGTRISIVKNLRVCIDCHVVTGLISKIEGREIVARDSSRFHHFSHGVCSCNNHW